MAELLFNVQGNRWEYIDDAEVSKAIGSKQYIPDPKRPLYVMSPEGHRSEMPLSEAYKALEQGWTVETSAQRHKAYQDGRWYGMREPAIAATMAAGNGLTGVTDLAIGGLADDERKKELARIYDEHPVARGMGEAVGFITALGTGGLTRLAGEGAVRGAGLAAAKGVVGGLPRAAVALGQAAGQATAKGASKLLQVDKLAQAARLAQAADRGEDALRLAGVAEKAVSRASLLGKVAAGAAESVPLSVGLAIGDAVLNDHDVDSELILANAGMGALLGGAFPLAGHWAGAGAKKMAPHLATVAAKVAGAPLDDPAVLAAMQKSHPILRFMAPVFAMSGRGTAAEYKHLALRSEAARLVDRVETTIERHVASGKAAGDGVANGLDELQELFGKQGKFKATAEQFDGVDPLQSNKAAREMLDEIADDLDNYADGMLEHAGLAPGLAGEVHTIAKDARARSIRLRQRYAAEFTSPEARAAKWGDEPMAVHAARELDTFKKNLGEIVQARSAQSRAGKTGLYDEEALLLLREGGQVPTLMRSYRGVYPRVQELLENETVFGKSFATTQREVNQAWSHALDTREVFEKMLMKVGSKGFQPLREVDDKKLRSFVSEGWHETNVRFDKMQEHYESVVELSKQFRKHVDDPAVVAAANKAEKNAVQALAGLKEMRADIGALHLAGELDRVAGGSVATAMAIGGALGAGIGASVGDVGGMGAGSAVGTVLGGALLRPTAFFRTAARFQQAKDRFFAGMRTRTSSAVRGVATKARASLREEHFTTVRRLATVSFAGSPGRPGESRAEGHARIMRELSQSDEVAHANLTKALEPISGLSPQVAEKVVSRIMQGRAFLQAKSAALFGAAPKGMLNRDLPPPESKLVSWERYVMAVDDPISALEEVVGGMTTVEEVEALRAVYPRLYQEAVALISEELAYLDTPPPRHVQMQLSTFFGLGVDATTRPGFARKIYARDMQTAGLPQPTNPAGHSGVVNRGQSRAVADMHMTRGQRNQVA